MKDTHKTFDGLLVLEYQSGNTKAMSLLVKRYHKKLCGHAFWYTKDIDVSKDIVQDSWKVIIQKMNSLKEPNNFGSWATKIVTRKSLDFINKENRKREHLKGYYEASKNGEDRLDKESEINKLLHAIRLLPKNQQIVLKLFYIEEYSLKEMSNILEISVVTVKSRLFHAREKLKTILKKQ
ncbi:RNA polymerase sigma-70 factor (ECF subfamily) [Saonia flava]|uniref:RNA polymerase sigma-70 factor (ECF subfamily) n=1 Tax=Saonia flava TaxID=523696 RepID=A0A846QKS4_9FLAO|nr:sigma-70 family RNA polymerase sigma factor [Saonia flava]NJB69546.1 RNA polymerase sigma-70 factor (ECF subfamily) [Saonia flava]